MTRTITALFDTVEAANGAARDVAERVGGGRGRVYESRETYDSRTLPIPAEDRATLDENIRRGGAVFHAQVLDEKFEAVSTVLEEAGAAHFDERETAWRREGWTGSSSAAATTTTGATTFHT